MQLYILDNYFRVQQVLARYNSLIWTERYSDSGDFSLVVPATPQLIKTLWYGTKLKLDESDEIMTVDTLTIKDGLVTITGKSLLERILTQRALWWSAQQYNTQQTYTNQYPTDIIIELFETVVYTSAGGSPNFTAPNDNWTNLYGQVINPSTETVASYVATAGPGFDAVKAAAQALNVGVKIRLMYAYGNGAYALMFTAYNGRDLTSDQDANPVVQFSANTNTLDGIEEVYSNATYKNVAYAYANLPQTVNIGGTDETLSVGLGHSYLDSAAFDAVDFDRNCIIVSAPDFNIDNFDQSDLATLEADIQTYLNGVATNALLNNTYTHTVDGTVVPQAKYQYQRDYDLGDIIELAGASGATQQARVSEYIRSVDTSGTKEYPTLQGIT